MKDEVLKSRAISVCKNFLITYFIEKCGFTIKQIIDLKPEDAISLLAKSNDVDVAKNLKEYLTTRNRINVLQQKQLFFPGRKSNDGKASDYSILLELHSYLKSQGRTLADIGLRLRDRETITKKKSVWDNASEPEDIFALAAELFK